MLKGFKTILILLLFSLVAIEGKNTPGSRDAKLCLILIVKNEEHVIERCLKSISGLIDYICIYDVGVTDDTINRIKEFMLEHGIPGKIFKNTWRNFGYNRTLAIENAQKTLKEKGFFLEKTYLLTLDADMELKIAPSFSKSSLNNDAYLIPVKSASFCCYKYDMHLLRASLIWESLGIVNEYWSHKGPFQSVRLNSLQIDDHADGNCTAEKWDVALLTQALEDDPGNTRHVFSLAQRQRCLKNFDEAIKLYNSCIEKGASKEEAWFSKYMIGECYEEMGYWDHALHWYLDAFQSHPIRAEPLLKIASYYRYRGQNDLACLFAKYGSRIPYADEQSLSQIPFQTDYQFDQELSIAAYYTYFRNDGYIAGSDLLLRRNVPWFVKDQTARNLLFYVENLNNARFQAIDPAFPLIEEGFDERYHPMNPSIQKTRARI